MLDFIEAYNKQYKNKTCAILGGGTSLPKDMRLIPDVDVLIGVNQHSLILPLDYVCFVDGKMFDYVKDHNITIITRRQNFTDEEKRNNNIIVYRQSLVHNYSGALALKAADTMGFSKIYVCGMDQYDKPEDGRYYWWEGPQTPERQKDKKNHDSPLVLRNFIRSMKSPQNVYFASGRMKEIHQ